MKYFALSLLIIYFFKNKNVLFSFDYAPFYIRNIFIINFQKRKLFVNNIVCNMRINKKFPLILSLIESFYSNRKYN